MLEGRLDATVRYATLLSRAKEEGGEDALLAIMRKLALGDLFFLLTRILRRPDADIDWCYDRCREFQLYPDGYLDLWAREHYKSTIITFAGTIQEILRDPNITVGLFSHTRPMAKAFLRQIKQEFEMNKVLLNLFPDILWQKPQQQSPKWSEDEGIIVQRTSNPKESTIEAYGLVDGQPTSRHYGLMVYDDIVTKESISTPEMVAKTTSAWELSINLESTTGTTRKRYIGTRWHYYDTWREIIKRGSAIPRIYTEEDARGNLVMWDRETQRKKRRDMGPYTYACQIKQNPQQESIEKFDEAWLRYWARKSWNGMNRYILVDPANEKKKENDFTVMAVVGLGADGNYYLIDGLRDRLNLVERTKWMFRLHRMYKPRKVGYEQYGMQADIQHIETEMERMNYRFRIIPLGGNMPKIDRIKRLIPHFDAGEVYLPEALPFRNYQGEKQDFIVDFLDEYQWFPFAEHDDVLDAFARILDPDLRAQFPSEANAEGRGEDGVGKSKEEGEDEGHNALRHGLGRAA